MPESSLENYVAYKRSLELFDFVIGDVEKWLSGRTLERIVSQQIASADSVCANIEEGFGRESRTEFRRFLSIARGSLRETRGRYLRFRHWIPEEIVQQRLSHADDISRKITGTLNTLKMDVRSPSSDTRHPTPDTPAS